MRAINITFKGKTYTIPAHKAFAAADAVEDIATLAVIGGWQTNPHFSKMARCYGVLLRFAGANVSDEEVKSEIMDQIKAMNVEAKSGVDVDRGKLFHLQAIEQLIAVIMDGMPESMQGDADADEDDPDGKKIAAS